MQVGGGSNNTRLPVMRKTVLSIENINKNNLVEMLPIRNIIDRGTPHRIS
jgi:hypothetical protein